MSEIAACLGAVAVLLHPSLITAKAAHPEQGGRVIKPYELLTNLMPSGISLCNDHGYINMQDVGVFRPCGC